jgi:hypothetical protein
MKQVETIQIKELSSMAGKMYGNLVKAVVDLKRGLLVVDAEMHADEEKFLLESGSAQNDLWGINLYPEKFGTSEFVEFDSMINIRPSQKNRSRGVEDESIRGRIMLLVSKKVQP